MAFLLHSSSALIRFQIPKVIQFSGDTKCNGSAPRNNLSADRKKPIHLLSSEWVADIKSKSLNFFLTGSLALALSLTGSEIAEGKFGVNKPELLPREFTPVIDVAGFLSEGQV